MKLSVVIPAYDEEKNIKELYSRVSFALKGIKGSSHEIIFVDDGSRDRTFAEISDIAKKDKSVKGIKLRKNFGQTAAWDAGFKNASGDIIITMDADLQNDPADIPKLLHKMDEGYDVVSGWRVNRQDSFSKRFFSGISRFLRNRIISDYIHDSGCSLKAYKKECLEGLDLHGEMHRYITQLLALRGYKIGEVKVNHLPRRHGKTKYNLIRLQKGFLDLLVVAFWQKYSARPIHLFGGAGIILSMLGFFSGAYLLYLKFFLGQPIAERPLLVLSALLVIVGIQFTIFGLIADILVKIYYSGGKKTYSVEKII